MFNDWRKLSTWIIILIFIILFSLLISFESQKNKLVKEVLWLKDENTNIKKEISSLKSEQNSLNNTISDYKTQINNFIQQESTFNKKIWELENFKPYDRELNVKELIEEKEKFEQEKAKKEAEAKSEEQRKINEIAKKAFDTNKKEVQLLFDLILNATDKSDNALESIEPTWYSMLAFSKAWVETEKTIKALEKIKISNDINKEDAKILNDWIKWLIEWYKIKNQWIISFVRSIGYNDISEAQKGKNLFTLSNAKILNSFLILSDVWKKYSIKISQ